MLWIGPMLGSWVSCIKVGVGSVEGSLSFLQCRSKRSNSGGRGGPWQMRFLQNPCAVEKLKQVQEVHLTTEEPPRPHRGFSLSNNSVELWRLFPAGVKTTTACLLMAGYVMSGNGSCILQGTHPSPPILAPSTVTLLWLTVSTSFQTRDPSISLNSCLSCRTLQKFW